MQFLCGKFKLTDSIDLNPFSSVILVIAQYVPCKNERELVNCPKCSAVFPPADRNCRFPLEPSTRPPTHDTNQQSP